MESKNGSGEKTQTHRKNFMNPGLETAAEVLQKREDFAVSLRKQQKKQILQAKRRKIAESLSNQM